MPRDPRKYLFDIRRAADLVAEFTAGKQLGDYLREPMLRAAVEREFEIIGEAMTQLARLDGEIAARISHRRRAISFRNTLIHGYDEIDDEVVWDTVTVDLPPCARRSTRSCASSTMAPHEAAAPTSTSRIAAGRPRRRPTGARVWRVVRNELRATASMGTSS